MDGETTLCIRTRDLGRSATLAVICMFALGVWVSVVVQGTK